MVACVVTPQIIQYGLESRTLYLYLCVGPCPRSAESPMSSGGKEWKPTKEFVVDGDDDLKAFNDFLFKRVSSCYQVFRMHYMAVGSIQDLEDV